MNQFDRDRIELGWLTAMALWLENRQPRSGFPAGPVFALEVVQKVKPM